MKIKVGDKVKFLNDTGGGIVSEIIDDRMVNVRIEDGFDIPALISELIIDRDDNELNEKPYELDNKPEDSTKSNSYFEKITDNIILAGNLPEKTLRSVYFGMVPAVEKMIYKSDIDTYLINDCDFYIYYLTGYFENTSFIYLKSGLLEANTKERMKTFTQTEISKIKRFHFQILFISKGRYFPQDPVDCYFDISKISFYKENNYKDNEFFHEKAYIFKIAGDNPEGEIIDLKDSEIPDMSGKKGTKKKANKVISKSEPDIKEVDLHIHEIADDYSDLTEGEILNIQLNRFHSELDNAIERNLKKIIFIHGLGNGKLKYEIRKSIDSKYPDITYQDASFKEYGFGATLVRLS
ncbi:MAG: DUF2027 domain-containing protein [Bacteroidales bacterium]|nr:MAG: DUF2027 domain-containing protein [Bacteroidales bacterium]